MSYSEKLSGFSKKWFFKIILIDISLSYPQSHQHLTCVVHCTSTVRVRGRDIEERKGKRERETQREGKRERDTERERQRERRGERRHKEKK